MKGKRFFCFIIKIRKKEVNKTNYLRNYFFLFGLSVFPLHFLQEILPAKTFMFIARTVVLQFLQTNLFWNNRASASGNRTIVITQILIVS